MDKINLYHFAWGDAEQLNRGELDSMYTADSFEGVKFGSTTSRIVLPRFIGVYQIPSVILHGRMEIKKGKRIRRDFEKMMSFANDKSNDFLASTLGIEDNVHPYLIHAIYDSLAGWTEKLARDCMNDRLGRVAFSDRYDFLLDFYKKNIPFTLDFILEDGQRLYEEGKSKEEILKVLGPRIDELNTHSREYGLTREEYMVLEKLQRIRRPKSDILVDPLSLKFMDLLHQMGKGQE